jgi:hypothetical protein
MDYIQDTEPIEVDGLVVASYGCECGRLPLSFGSTSWGCAVRRAWQARCMQRLHPCVAAMLIAADDPGLGCPVEYINLKVTDGGQCADL